MRRSRIATLILVNGPPGVGKSTVARRLRDDRPRALLVDFDDLWLLIGGWSRTEGTQELAVTAGLAMARAHLAAGHDVVAAQFAVARDFFAEVDSLVAETGAAYHEIVLTAPHEEATTRFRRRRAARARAGEPDVSANIADGRVDEVVAWAADALAVLATARAHAVVISADGDPEATYVRVRAAVQPRPTNSSGRVEEKPRPCDGQPVSIAVEGPAPLVGEEDEQL